jgi:hypothetical protein
MRILSIDIGYRNCAFYIEEFDEKMIENCKSIESLYKIGTRIYWKVVDFTRTPYEDVMSNVIDFLDKNKTQWDYCSGIIIERQLDINRKAQVLQHFIYSYYRNLYGPFKYISEISATRKTQCLNAPKMKIKTDRKKWAINEVNKICGLRNDEEGFCILNTKKADDLADCCLQLKAFQKLVFMDKKEP